MPYATFGIEVNSSGNVTKAAPIAGWTVGKPMHNIKRFYENKGMLEWNVVEIPTNYYENLEKELDSIAENSQDVISWL